MQFNVIGPGRLGQNLCLSLITHAQFHLQGLLGLNLDKAKSLVHHLGQGKAYAHLNHLPQAPLTLITTPDSEIESIVNALTHTQAIPEGGMVIHCSGACASSLLNPLKEKFNAHIGSFHPLRPFSTGHYHADSLKGTHLIFEGDDVVLTQLAPAFLKCGALLSQIEPKAKPLYHASAVFASNYPLLLLNTAEKNFIDIGIPEHDAKAMSLKLMQTALQNYEHHLCAQKALTGPLARGDIKTIELHLAHLPKAQEQLYRILGKGLIDLTTLEDELKVRLRKYLGE